MGIISQDKEFEEQNLENRIKHKIGLVVFKFEMSSSYMYVYKDEKTAIDWKHILLH